MPISTATVTRYICPHCDAENNLTEWVGIDVAERPDLASVLARGDWLTSSCAVCGNDLPRATPLLVTRLSELAPVVLAVSYDTLDSSADPFADTRDLLDATRERMGEAAREAPGPVLVVPLDVAAVAASRELALDLAAPARAVEALRRISDTLASNYATFLDAVRDSLPERRLSSALDHLLAVRDASELRDLFARYPELRSDDALSRAREWLGRASEGEERHVAAAQVALLEKASVGDFEGAWAAYERAVLEMSVGFLTPRISALFDELSTRIDARDWVAAVPIGEELLALAGKTGGEHIEAPASQQLAIALYELHGPGRAERLERVIALLGRALEIYDRHPELADAASRALALQNLGTAYAERLIGDPVANQERAIALQRRALELISREADGRSWAMAEANLGLSLLELARQRDWEESEGEDESEGEEEPAEMRQAAEEIEEGMSHLERSLEWRSVERDPRDFAYTKTNLGLAFNRRMRGDRRANIETALRHYEEAANAFARSKDELQLAQVKHNTSSARLELALMEESAERRAALLEAAIADARGALEVRSLDDAPYHAGRSWRQLGECLRASGDRAGAIDAFTAALEGLTPEIAPEQARDTARGLAELATDDDDWAVAATAWNHAAEAAANALEARVTGAGRSSERRRNLNVFRFAAYAVARAGDLERAVEILELGRARELAAWVSRDLLDLERVRALEPRLAEPFIALQSELERFERHSDGAEAGFATQVAEIAEARRRVIDEIRQLPGLASFLERPTFAELAGSLSEGEAIAYLLTSPRGSLALLVDAAAAEGVAVEAIQAPDLRSTDLVSLFLGFDLEGNIPDAPGYFFAHRDDVEELDAAIDRFSPLLGERLLRWLDEALSRREITSVCLIPISLLGLLPLHALPWNDAGRARCLIDRVVVSFAPSAFVRRVCRSRAEFSGPARRAVIVGNPLPQTNPLDGAELEAALVASSLTGAQTEVIVGTDATKDRVVAALPGADLAHFACHAAASIFGGHPGEAALFLANDEPLTAEEIRTFRSFRPRLVVASACESGVIEGYEEADEALSLGVMFIAAGAAGVISTLWAIDDYATMLLMTRFYELLDSEHAPERALRAAQLWLRELTPAEENAYLVNRAALRARRDEKRQRGEARGDVTAALGTTERPYAALSIWAAFIFSGA